MAAVAPPASRLRHVSLGAAVGIFVIAGGLVIGLRPLSDNSFFTHLATGRLILDSGSVPSHDPYTFTAHGSTWLVQSWLASVAYAAAERLGGALGLRLLIGVVAAALAGLAWRLTRPAASVLARLALGGLFVAVAAGMWSERPLMFGLVAFAVVMMAGDGLVDPRWLVPIGWVWVNVHGSFPLGVVYLLAVAAGRRLDGKRPSTELRVLRWLALGILLGPLGPLGPRVLSFPFELLQRQDVLSHVIEWRAPGFDSFSQRAFLLQIVLVLFAVVRRPAYRRAVPVAVFVAASLLGARNIAVASLVLLSATACAVPEWGALRSDQRRPLGTMIAAAGLGVAIVLGSARLNERHFDLRGYPIDALAFADEAGLDLRADRMATQDVVGNVIELLYGPEGVVFYDDRFDMFPAEVSEAHLALARSAPRLRSDLERLGVELVLWERSSSTAQRLMADADWRVLYSDEGWVLACSRGADIGSSARTC